MRFEAIQSFFSDELRSHYETGLSYTVHDPASPLARLIPNWIAEGKIRVLPNTAPASALAGQGEVKGKA